MNKEFWCSKKVFVTGHTGFKGAWLCLLLTELGAEVYGYALEPNTTPSLFNIMKIDERIDHFIGEVRNFKQLKQRIQNISPEVVIHMAAQPLVRYGYKHPIETYSTNVMGTVYLFEALKNCNSVKAILNVTTDKCYDNKEWEWGYRENEAMGGYDPYSSSKACSELVTATYRNSYFNPEAYSIHGKALASARSGNVIGGGDWSAERLVPDLMTACMTGEIINIKNPHAIRPWQHVLEPLSGYLILLEKLWFQPTEFASAWNFGPDDSDAKPVNYIADYLTNHWQGKARWREESNSQLHEANYLKLNISKAKQYLDWYPRWSLDEALDSIIEWYQVYQSGGDIVQLMIKQIDSYNRKNDKK